MQHAKDCGYCEDLDPTSVEASRVWLFQPVRSNPSEEAPPMVVIERFWHLWHRLREDGANPAPKTRSVCALCDFEYTGKGHNAAPVADGRCCSECNAMKVVPARLASVE